MQPRDRPPGQLLDVVVSGIKGVLGDDLVALWVYGSAVTGDFDVGVSDVDLIAVTRAGVDPNKLADLGRMHDDLVDRHGEWRDRIEVVYLARATLESFRSSTGPVMVISPGELLHVREERPDAWLQNWYLVRKTGITLHGRKPVGIVPAIDWSEFVEATARYADELVHRDRAGAHGGSLAYDILTMCRAFRTVRLDTLSSKAEGASWVAAQMPDWRRLIDAAMECRRSGGRTGLSDDRSREATEKFIRIVADEIAAYRRHT